MIGNHQPVHENKWLALGFQVLEGAIFSLHQGAWEEGSIPQAATPSASREFAGFAGGQWDGVGGFRWWDIKIVAFNDGLFEDSEMFEILFRFLEVYFVFVVFVCCFFLYWVSLFDLFRTKLHEASKWWLEQFCGYFSLRIHTPPEKS